MSVRQAGVRVATILSDGFAEKGEAGARVQRAMVDEARAAGMELDVSASADRAGRAEAILVAFAARRAIERVPQLDEATGDAMAAHIDIPGRAAAAAKLTDRRWFGPSMNPSPSVAPRSSMPASLM